jgi:DNA-binding MarR family transcriptional regulator
MDISVDSGVELAHVLEQIVRVVRQLSTAGDQSLSAAATLTRVSTDGPQRLTDLAGWERQSQPGMTQLVSRLERDGLVHRTSLPSDRRVVLVEATSAGCDLVARRRVHGG